jgi:hypothetical protein
MFCHMSRAVEAEPQAGAPDLWRALASPWRRRLLDLLREAPATTGALAARIPELSRPMTEEEAAGISEYGDLRGYAPAIEKLAAG